MLDLCGNNQGRRHILYLKFGDQCQVNLEGFQMGQFLVQEQLLHIESQSKAIASSGNKNPHINRGMKGSIEWPQRIQRNSLKAKCMKAMTRSQKTQLHNLLKETVNVNCKMSLFGRRPPAEKLFFSLL